MHRAVNDPLRVRERAAYARAMAVVTVLRRRYAQPALQWWRYYTVRVLALATGRRCRAGDAIYARACCTALIIPTVELLRACVYAMNMHPLLFVMRTSNRRSRGGKSANALQ